MKTLTKLRLNDVESITEKDQKSIKGGGIYVTGPDGSSYWYVGEAQAIDYYNRNTLYWGDFFNSSNACNSPDYIENQWVGGSEIPPTISGDGSIIPYSPGSSGGGGGGGETGFYIDKNLYSVVLAQGYENNCHEYGNPGEDNPTILGFWNSVSWQATNDETAWCSAFVNYILDQSGREITRSGLAASWLDWGSATSSPQVGDIAVLDTTSWDHVGIVSRIENGVVYMISGNMSEDVLETEVGSGYVFRTDRP